ncbi:hypothetical protein PC116_g33551 [Phytophthora cactorum]|nr:hypothetical protein PC116_g33551 [Phytophthora cactorum]
MTTAAPEEVEAEEEALPSVKEMLPPSKGGGGGAMIGDPM